MRLRYHADVTLGALRRWLISQCYDSLVVSGLWFFAMFELRVPWALFWALLAGILQFIPHFGLLLALVGPAMVMLFTGAPLVRWFWLLGAYAAIATFDGLLLQPLLMHRQNRVPFWVSLLTPLALGMVFPFWGVLVAAPLLAVIYAYRGMPNRERPAGEQKFSSQGGGIILPPERDA